MFIPGGSAIETSGYNINNSLRFRSSASAYLNRTFATPTNNKIWTFSTWIKRGSLTSTQCILATSSEELRYIADGGASGVVDSFQYNYGAGYGFRTNATYRDPSAWYHIVVAVDTTQATAANRAKIYINGIQASTDGTYDISQNANTQINSAVAHNIGRRVAGSLYFDGYQTEINFIDGQALTPSSFGATDAVTGVWAPAAYTGSYGTNGFYLKFSDIATTSGSNAGLGKDFSGNTNYWTTNNISVTAGTTYDAMTDSPTLTSATVANYCVLNPLDKTAGTVSNGNLTIVKGSTGAFANIRGTMSVSSGKWYFETTLTSGINYSTIGILSPDVAFPSQIGDSASGWDWYPAFAEKKNNAVSTSYGTTASAGDIIMCAFDVTNGKIWWGKNGTWFASGDPAAGTNAAFTNVTGTVAPAVAVSGTTTQIDTNFGQRPFSYTPPTGFNRLNAYNLPDSTIKKGNSYMDATLYTGTGSSRSVTNTAGFKPDFVWGKDRGQAQGYLLFDSVRGVYNFLASNSADVEGTNNQTLTAFNSNGFQLGTNGTLNQSSQSFVGWQWQAGQGTTSSNTAGSISSTTSVSTTAGFSIVTYTGPGSGGGTVGHGLGVAPKMIIVKNRNAAESWRVGHAFMNAGSSPWNYYMNLNGTSAQVAASSVWNNTAPTSTVFSIANDSGVSGSGNGLVAYCWAEIAGFSKFGSYTGNGSTDGPFVYTGFRPKFILYKSSSLTESWMIYDTSRNPYNVTNLALAPQSSSAEFETTSINRAMDILSNGFKPRGSDGNINSSGATYIYAAFAENPFKNALAR